MATPILRRRELSQSAVWIRESLLMFGANHPTGLMSHGSRAIFTAATLEMVKGKAIPMRGQAIFAKE